MAANPAQGPRALCENLPRCNTIGMLRTGKWRPVFRHLALQRATTKLLLLGRPTSVPKNSEGPAWIARGGFVTVDVGVTRKFLLNILVVWFCTQRLAPALEWAIPMRALDSSTRPWIGCFLLPRKRGIGEAWAVLRFPSKALLKKQCYVAVVSSMFYFHPYLGKILILTTVISFNWVETSNLHSLFFFRIYHSKNCRQGLPGWAYATS